MNLKKNSLTSVSVYDFRSLGITIEAIEAGNVRDKAQYTSENLWKLADSLASTGGNHDPIELCTTGDALRIVRGNRRAVAFLASPLVREVKTPKGEVKVETIDLTDCKVAYVYLGELSERDYIARLADHATIQGLSKAGKYNTVKRFCLAGYNESETMRMTGLSKGSVQTPRKIIAASGLFPALAERLETGYLDGNLTADDANTISKIMTDSKASDADKERVIRNVLDKEHEAKEQFRTAKDIKINIYPHVGARYKAFLDAILPKSGTGYNAADWQD